jgi:hypothetical protein
MDFASCESRYDVRASEYVVGVDKTKCIVIGHGCKLNAVQFSSGPSRVTTVHSAVPPNPQDLHAMWLVVDHSRTNIYNVDVVNTNNLSISEWVIGGQVAIVVETSQDHDVTM